MPKPMPDIANQASAHIEGQLDWVGMSHIELPVQVATDHNEHQRVGAHVEAFVSLDDAQAKGIHMSRLYLALDEMSDHEVLDGQVIHQLLQRFLATHQDLSQQARVRFNFDLHLRRNSLLSGNAGWKVYPVVVTGTLNGDQFTLELQTDVTYSSTCPCSAALARQLIQDAFTERFGQDQVDAGTVAEWLGTTEGIVATPHSQRSTAEIRVKLDPATRVLPVEALVDTAEDTLKTPVQTAVKREDEQEFARLNGQNLMFCEDAARKLQMVLNQQSDIADFWIRINHYESLHPHDAVSITTKGIAGGYQP